MVSVKRFRQSCVALLGLMSISQCAKLRIYCNDDPTLQNYREVPLSTGETLLTSGCYNRTRKNFFFIFGDTGIPTGPDVIAVNGAAVQTAQYNVWLLNWEQEASTLFNSSSLLLFSLSFPLVMVEVIKVGNQFGDKLVDMTRTGHGFTVEDTYVIGHSVGAHLAAQAGKSVQSSNLLIQWIIGLDPAGPIYGLLPFLTLMSGDAKMVTSIHTDPGGLGINTTDSDVDIYVNYGNFLQSNEAKHEQPGCPRKRNQIISFGDSCSHARSWELFTEGIKNSYSSTNLVAASAESYHVWRDGLGDCSDTVTIGLELDLTKRGLYFLDTRSTSPYGTGPIGALC